MKNFKDYLFLLDDEGVKVLNIKNKKMTNQSILDIAESLEKVGQLKGEKFVYCIARNNNILRPIVKKYIEDRKVLQESFAKKDEKGEPILLDDKGNFGRPTKKYDIEDMKTFNKKLEELLKEEVEVKLYRIPQDILPADITSEQLTGLMELVDDNPIKQLPPK